MSELSDHGQSGSVCRECGQPIEFSDEAQMWLHCGIAADDYDLVDHVADPLPPYRDTSSREER